MHRLIIHKLGPITHCELTCSQFMTLTGFQASGKSTIAKAIYYFRTIKDDIYSLAVKKALSIYESENEYSVTGLKKLLIDELREKFLRVFGSSWGLFLMIPMTLSIYPPDMDIPLSAKSVPLSSRQKIMKKRIVPLRLRKGTIRFFQSSDRI